MVKHTVRVPAVFFDQWQPKLTPEEWSLLSALIRRTYGWDKMMDIVSTSQLIEMTGLHERTVRRRMASLLKSGVPVEVVCRSKSGTMYRITGIDSVTGDLTRYLSSDTGDRMQEPPPLLQSDTGDRMHRGFTSIRTPVTPTTKSLDYPGTAPRQPAQVAEQLPMRAASQEPPTTKILPIESPGPGSLFNKEGLVEDAPTTCKDLATATACASPAGQDTPGLVSSPRSWAHHTQPTPSVPGGEGSGNIEGDHENQPEATKQTPPPVPRRPLPFEPPAVVDDEEDEDTWTERVGAEEDLADGGPYVGCDEVPYTPVVAQEAPAEIKSEIPAPTVEEPVEPSADAPLTERITWHVQHGVRDVLVYMKACGRDYNAVIRAVTILKQQKIIHMVDGGWEMVTTPAGIQSIVASTQPEPVQPESCPGPPIIPDNIDEYLEEAI